jgi:hypothetical protein
MNSTESKYKPVRDFEEGSPAFEYLRWMQTQTYRTDDNENEDGRWLAYMSGKKVEDPKEKPKEDQKTVLPRVE